VAVSSLLRRGSRARHSPEVHQFGSTRPGQDHRGRTRWGSGVGARPTSVQCVVPDGVKPRTGERSSGSRTPRSASEGQGFESPQLHRTCRSGPCSGSSSEERARPFVACPALVGGPRPPWAGGLGAPRVGSTDDRARKNDWIKLRDQMITSGLRFCDPSRAGASAVREERLGASIRGANFHDPTR
jgi:hypothetical protein